jgi:hypothetical protein
MQRRKQRVLIKFLIWIVPEIILTVSGLDDLADYSEFVFDRPVQMAEISTSVNHHPVS